MRHLYKVYPKSYISGVRPKQIIKPTILENLNRQEFLKCFNGGELYAIINNAEIHIKECNYEKAEKLFEDNQNQIAVLAQLQSLDEVNKNERKYDPVVLGKNDALSTKIINAPYIPEDLAETALNTVEEQTETAKSATIENKEDDSKTESIPESSDAVFATGLSTDIEENTKLPESVTTVASVDETKNVVNTEGNIKQNAQQYNKNHNNQSGQSNYHNQKKHGKNNKGKFVINN